MADVVRTPNVRDIDAAVRLYYEKFELSSKDIQEIFEAKSSATVSTLKKIAREEMSKRPGRKPWDDSCVPTDIAYDAWGLKIADLERRRRHLIMLGVIREPNVDSEGAAEEQSAAASSEVSANV